MDSNATYIKTNRGLRAIIKKLPRNAGLVLSEIDGTLTVGEVLSRLGSLNEGVFQGTITWLIEGGFIKPIVVDPFSDSVWDQAAMHNAVEVDEIGLDQFTVSEKPPAGVTKPIQSKNQTKQNLSDADKIKIKALHQADIEAHERAEAALNAKIQAENAPLPNEQKNTLGEFRFEQEVKTSTVAEENAKKKAEEKAAEEKRKIEAEKKEQREAQERAEEEQRKAEEAEAKAKAAAEENAKKEATAKKKAEEKRKIEAEKKEQHEAQERVEEEQRKAEEAEAKAKAAAEENAKKEATAKKKAEEKRKIEAEKKEQREAQERVEEEQRKAEEAEAKAKAAAEENAKKEATAKKKAEERAVAKEQARLEATARKESKLRIKADKKAKAKAEAEKRALEKAAAKEQTRLEAAEEKGLLAEEEIEQYLYDHDDEKEAPNKLSLITPIKRGLTTIVSSIKPLSIYAIAVLFLLIIAAQFINFHIWINPIERVAKKNIQDSVSIKAVRITFFPSPHLILEGVTVADSKTITAEKVHVYPNITNLKNKLLNASKSPYKIESIRIENFKIAQKDLSRITSWQGASSRDQQLKIDKISLKNMVVQLNKLELPSFDGEILFDNAGLMKEATMTSESKNITAVISLTNDKYLIGIEAIRWRAPISPYPVFTKLNAKASINNDQLAFSNITGTLYNGTLGGSLNIDLASESLASKGTFTLNDFYLADMAEELKLNTAVDGKLKATGQFSFNFNKPLNSISNGQLSSTFSIKSGYLKTVDLTEAMRSGNLSGYTKFTSLSGKASLSNETYRFSKLLLRHNQLSARGQLTLNPEHYVSGIVSSTIAMKRNPIRSRLNISGPITAMKLKN